MLPAFTVSTVTQAFPLKCQSRSHICMYFNCMKKKEIKSESINKGRVTVLSLISFEPNRVQSAQILLSVITFYFCVFLDIIV